MLWVSIVGSKSNERANLGWGDNKWREGSFSSSCLSHGFSNSSLCGLSYSLSNF